MKIRKFLNQLTTREKIFLILGATLEKAAYKLDNYSSLKFYKNLLADVEYLGFNYFSNRRELILEKNNSKIVLRKSSSDYNVFHQVFVRNEYQPVINCIVDNKLPIDTIVDAGSNIGLTSIKLLNNFPNAKIICLEPDPQNYQQLNDNLNSFRDRATILQNALWHKKEDLQLDFTFRDGKDWSRAVVSSDMESELTVKGISLNNIIEDYNLAYIDLLKIDIEGSEAKIFGPESDLSFLEKVNVIAIEIHDEFNCRKDIYEILKSRNFILFNTGELTIGVKKGLQYVR